MGVDRTHLHVVPGAGARYRLDVPQEVWGTTTDESAGLLTSARFAGQEMLALSDDNKGLPLTYRGLPTSGFSSMVAAQAVGLKFAQGALAFMASRLAD